MATTAVEPVFVDTNCLIYAQQSQSPFHAVATDRLQDLVTNGHPLWISRQVLREYLVVMSRPGSVSVPVAIADLVADVQSFESQFNIAEDGPVVMSHMLTLLTSIPCSGKQVHDANVVATMLTHGIPQLLTHNVSDFNRFSGQITVLPLIPSSP
jgi:predicted nucleic acid-binding protein